MAAAAASQLASEIGENARNQKKKKYNQQE